MLSKGFKLIQTTGIKFGCKFGCPLCSLHLCKYISHIHNLLPLIKMKMFHYYQFLLAHFVFRPTFCEIIPFQLEDLLKLSSPLCENNIGIDTMLSEDLPHTNNVPIRLSSRASKNIIKEVNDCLQSSYNE